MWLSRIVRWLAVLGDFVLPRHPHVQRAERITIDDIAARIQPQQLPHAKWIAAFLPYQDPEVRAIIKSIKYYADHESAKKVAYAMSPHISDALSDKNSFAGWDTIVIIPIPASRKRFRERGYAQTELIARAISDEINIPIDVTSLSREDRPSQARIQKSERANNISMAFTSSDMVRGKCVVLIDDVVESGATLNDARRALLAAGAKDVVAFAIAH